MDNLFNDEQTGQRQEPTLDVTSHAFQAKKYIQRVLADVPHAVFEGELVDRVGQAEEDTGEALKQLIRDNLAVFVNSKDAMDAVFHSDQELFTGEALDGITQSFKSATSSCEALVQPITTTFVEMQKSRKSQDMLDKLFSVLGVPGAIYESCGTKVATRRASAVGDLGDSDTSQNDRDDDANTNNQDTDGSTDKKKSGHADEGDDNDEDSDSKVNGQQSSSGSPAVRAMARRPRGDQSSYNAADDDGEEEEEEEEEGSDDLDGDGDDEGGGGGAGKPSPSHGALENLGGPINLEDVFVFSPEEEIYSWYGTPLVRLRDVDERRHHVEEVSNYEAAVLHLRRAMLYLEETYSLMDGTMLAGEDGDVPPPKSPPAPAAAASANGGAAGSDGGRYAPSPGAASGNAASVPQPPMSMSTTSRLGTARRSAFAYKYSMALLRSALYLCSQLAEELVYANPADTVLIEDTLSMMMDASIATVKLHHFCNILQKSMEWGTQHTESLTKLRTQLGAASAGAAPGSLPKEALGAASSSNTAPDLETPPPPPLSPSASTRTATAAAAGGGSGGAPRLATAYQHPVQYFISIVQKQHRHLFYSSAAALLQEANAWMWKAQTDAARGLEERHRQRELQRKLLAAAANGVDTGEDASVLGATGTFGHNFTNSFMGASVAGEGGLIGNSNDSFLQDTSFGWLNRRGGGGSGGTNGGPSPLQTSQQQRQQIGSPSSRENGTEGSPHGFEASASGAANHTNNNNNNSGDAQLCASLVPEVFVTRMLDAFNTPESPFPTTTEFKVGSSDMDAVLLSSCLQIRMHAVSLLSQLFTRADIESAVMAQATALNTFALRLCAECVGTLEHVVGSYWGGIASTLHAGVFDFVPDGTLKDMLLDLVTGSPESAGDGQAAGPAVGADARGRAEGRTDSMDAEGLQRSPSTMLGGGDGSSAPLSRVPSELGDASPTTPSAANVSNHNNNSSAGAAQSAGFKMAGIGSGSTDQLPRIRFVPTLPQALHQQQQQSNSSVDANVRKAGDASDQPPLPPRPTCLRAISVQAVQQMISSATSTLQTLFLAFINKGAVDGFISTIAHYRVSDAVRYSRTERIELHAAVLYEILLGQWERMMNLVSDSVLRLKIVMGESSSSTTVNSDSQVEEVGSLLQELEVLRSTCLRTYLHGVGVLSKAYLTMLPLLQRRSDASLDARVRSRLSRESVSSNMVHKLLNMLSVVVDRCVPFFTRDTEVFDSVDLFSVKAEAIKDDDNEDENAVDSRGDARGGTTGRRLRLMRSRRGAAGATAGSSDDAHRPSRAAASTALNAVSGPSTEGPDTAADPVSELLAQFHSKLVMESLQDHEEVVLALLSHLLLAFVDTQQLKCRTATTDASVAPDERERIVVECMADTLTLATTLTPILMEHLLSPCFFELLARQLPEVASSPAGVAAYLENKRQQYMQVYLSVVEEHCQLAVDAMMNTYLALTQQPITDFVRRQGFVQPLFDWQRVSPHTTAAVRPYIADAIACIARAHETLNAIRQPILGSAATQRLVAHLVRVFLTAFSSDVNVFELSVECSSSFLVLGLTLLEAEALTILKVAETVVAHAAANPTSSELSAELVVAKDTLANFAQSLDTYANSVCESIAATRGREGASEAAVSLSFLARDKRHERRDSMVQAALRALGYMLEAINVELEESSLSSAGLMQLRSSVTESIVQRLEHRNEGYELRRAKAAQKEQERRNAEKRASAALNKRKKAAAAATTATVAGDEAAEGEGGSGGQRRVRRRSAGPKPLLPSGANADDANGGGVVTPRTAQEQERETSNALAAASNVLQLAQDQQQKTKVRKVRKARKAAPVLDSGAPEGLLPAGPTPPLPATGADVAAAPPLQPLPPPPPSLPSAATATTTTTPAAPLPRRRGVVRHNDDNDGDGDSGAEAAAAVRVRPARRGARRGVAATANDNAEPRERRANRFHRSNVV